MSYLLAFLGFAALIILHEFGHFAVAKTVGMRVERFSLFFGPMLIKTRRGETEYGIGPIPLGGYVKITGMNPHEEIPAEYVPRAYYNQKVWKRIVVIMAGPGMNFLIAFVLIMGIYWSQGIAVTSHGQQVYTRTIAAHSLSPPASNYLKAGDQIVGVDGKRNLSVDQITSEIGRHRCAGGQTPGCQAQTPVTLLVRRGRAMLSLAIYPRFNPDDQRMLIGIGFAPLVRPVGPLGAAGRSVSEMWYVTHTTVTRIATLFEPKSQSQVHSVVGAFKITQQEIAFDTTAALFTLALISLALAVVNLFPFLPLDGGHVFWALAEKIRGRRIPVEVMERAGAVGFVLIMIVFAIGLSNDISALSGHGFGVR